VFTAFALAAFMMPTHDAFFLMFMMIHMTLLLYYEMNCAKIKLQRATSNEPLGKLTALQKLHLQCTV
jgi:hypothetical protein